MNPLIFLVIMMLTGPTAVGKPAVVTPPSPPLDGGVVPVPVVEAYAAAARVTEQRFAAMPVSPTISQIEEYKRQLRLITY